MKKLGFAVIGCGIIGKLHAEVIDQLEDANLVAVCSASEASAKALGDKHGCPWYTDYDKLLQDPNVDAVAICTPSGLHYEQTLAAARAKKHIVCEKPVDIDVEKAKEMTAVCQENGVVFSVIFQHRFDKCVMALRKAVEEGHFGKLRWGSSRTVTYRDDAYYYDNPWHGSWDLDGGGALINQSVHFIDLLVSFFGPVKSVSGKCRKVSHHNIDTEDLGVATVEFTSGAIGTIEGSTACYPGLYAELSLFGEKGSAVIRNETLVYCKLMGETPDYLQELISETLIPKIPAASHLRQFEGIVKSINEGTTPEVTGDDALISLELIKAIYTSSDEKREVFLQKHL